METKDFVVFDGDSHVVEPPALWEKYLDPEYRTLGKHALWRQEGAPLARAISESIAPAKEGPFRGAVDCRRVAIGVRLHGIIDIEPQLSAASIWAKDCANASAWEPVWVVRNS